MKIAVAIICGFFVSFVPKSASADVHVITTDAIEQSVPEKKQEIPKDERLFAIAPDKKKYLKLIRKYVSSLNPDTDYKNSVKSRMKQKPIRVL